MTDRRAFLQALGGGVLVIGTVQAQEHGGARRREMPQQMGAWLHIGADGTIAVFTGKAEVGQNTRTSLTQAVAEELHVPVTSVQLVMADTDRVPYDMGTFGSLSTPVMAPQLHRVGAAARELLINLAADEWGVERSTIAVRDGVVTKGDWTRRATFQELTRGRQLVETVPLDAPVTPVNQWTVCGTPVPKVNGRDMVTGRHRYSADLARPGMLHARVLRPPSFGAQLDSFDGSAAAALPGVTVLREGNFAGIAAPDRPTAERAVKALRATWRTVPQPAGAALYSQLVETAGPADTIFERGSVEEGLRAGAHHLQAEYRVAYIAHTPLEPRAALAEWDGGKLTVHTGSQRPFGVREELARVFGIPEERVRVIVPDTGSGYGGKHTGEAAIEAARLAKASGRPVKLVWTREEEFTWAYARPAGVIRVAASAGRDGKLTAWELTNYNSGTAGIRGTYQVANERVRFHESKSPLRQGAYRALAATANHFARETHLNELAHMAGLDPLAFRLKNLEDPRQRAVLAAAAERFGWHGRKGAAGIAAGFEKRGYVATVAEVDVHDGQVRVTRVVTAFECGAVVNPDALRNQVEGAIVMGLGGALFEALRFDNGRITNARLRTYRVPRFRDLPELETVLVDRKDLPSVGAGECPIVAVAPAIAAAIHAATGRRLRALPLAPDGLK